jgi:hypothetical protein
MIQKILFVMLLALAAAAQQTDSTQPGPQPTNSKSADPQTAVLPLTSKSPQARRLVEEAMMLYLDQVEQTQSIEILRAAIKIDQNFAMGHEFLAWVSLDPSEQVS